MGRYGSVWVGRKPIHSSRSWPIRFDKLERVLAQTASDDDQLNAAETMALLQC